MLFIVDGTSTYALHDAVGSEVASNPRYDWDMRNSFCVRMRNAFKGRYFRGPATFGTECGGILRDVEEQIPGNTVWLGRLSEFDPRAQFEQAAESFTQLYNRPAVKGAELFFAGHSRGGAIVLELAHHLARSNIPIKAMFIFDGVDRTEFSDLYHTQELPRNVEYIFHARRDINGLEDEINSALDQAYGTEFPILSKSGKSALPSGTLDNNNVKSFSSFPSKLINDYERGEELEKIQLATRGHFVFNYDLLDGHLLKSIFFGNILDKIPDDGDGGFVPNKENKYFVKWFAGTHGALGGSPIIDDFGAPLSPGESDDSWAYSRYLVMPDRAAMREVWDWMTSNFRLSGLCETRTDVLPDKSFA